MARRMLIAGNWKMNGMPDQLGFFSDLHDQVGSPGVDVLICPPFPLIPGALDACAETSIRIGAQDCHPARAGAHTGDVSAALLAQLGVHAVIVGHSERREDHAESDAVVRGKAEAAISAGLVPIICVGETLAEREAGEAGLVVTRQLAGSIPETGRFVLAYEPVWAIGTGLTASLEDIAAMHAVIRGAIRDGDGTAILYGGSVKPGNAADILALDDVDGALVGGASLEAASFAAIVRSAVI